MSPGLSQGENSDSSVWQPFSEASNEADNAYHGVNLQHYMDHLQTLPARGPATSGLGCRGESAWLADCELPARASSPGGYGTVLLPECLLVNALLVPLFCSGIDSVMMGNICFQCMPS